MNVFHLGIDIQTLFTFEKKRGIGRYTFLLIESLIKKSSEKFKISLFGFEPEPPEEIKPLLNNHTKYRQFKLPQPKDKYLEYGVESPFLWNKSAVDIDWFLATSPLMLDIVVPEGGPCKVAAVLYDLIPYLFQGQCRKIDVGRLRQTIYPPVLWDRYNARLNHLKTYDHFFAISHSTKESFVEEIDIAKDKISVLYCGIGDVFTTDKNPALYAELKNKLNLPEKFIFNVSGFNFRKNIEGSIRIYSKLPEQIKKEFHYVIHCNLQSDERRTVEYWIKHYSAESNIADKIILTGETLTEEELAEIYRNSSLFFFPSYYEGLGLPVLEAMACGVPVICSNTSSLAEIIADTGVGANPENEEEFTRELGALLLDSPKREQFKKAGLEFVKKFSWEKAADEIISALMKIENESKPSIKNHIDGPVKKSGKKRLAFFSPLNPLHSGISDYSESLLHELRNLYDIDIFVEDYTPTSEDIVKNHQIFSYKDFNKIMRNVKYDLNVFQMGNNSIHKTIYKMIMTHPGLVVMHEYSLCGFFIDGLNKYFNFTELWDLLLAEPERDIDAPPADIHQYLTSLKPLEIPFLKDIVRNAKRIIVHSEWLKNKIIKWRSSSEEKGRIEPLNSTRSWPGIDVVQMGADAPPQWVENENPLKIKDKFQIPQNSFVIAVVGTITRFKRMETILEAFDMFRKRCPEAQLVISGTCADIGYYIEIQQIIERRRFGTSVKMLGYMDMNDLIQLIIASDICVNLRYPTLGEMSGIIPRILGLGKPLIVTDSDSFSELPDSCCLKVRVGRGEEFELASLFSLMMKREDVRKQMGEKAIEFVRDCSWKKTAERYSESIESAIERVKSGKI